MKLSTKGRYGIKAMVDIALEYGKGRLSVNQLAEKQGISVAYLEQIIAALKKAGQPRFTERAACFAPLLGVHWQRISIRCQKSKWGSCSGKGNLNFNCLLLLAPPEVLDYVVVHELCHLLEMNHSPRFWALVESILPDYAERRRWLREHGAALLARVY